MELFVYAKTEYRPKMVVAGFEQNDLKIANEIEREFNENINSIRLAQSEIAIQKRKEWDVFEFNSPNICEYAKPKFDFIKNEILKKILIQNNSIKDIWWAFLLTNQDQ